MSAYVWIFAACEYQYFHDDNPLTLMVLLWTANLQHFDQSSGSSCSSLSRYFICTGWSGRNIVIPFYKRDIFFDTLHSGRLWYVMPRHKKASVFSSNTGTATTWNNSFLLCYIIFYDFFNQKNPLWAGTLSFLEEKYICYGMYVFDDPAF